MIWRSEGFARAGGILGAGVLELAAGRHFNIQPNRQPLPPYAEAEWEGLSAVCRGLVEESYAAHRKALTSIAGARYSAEGGWTVENFCWLLARTGPIGTPDFARAVGATSNVFRNRGGTVR
jgi:hypothetical protein